MPNRALEQLLRPEVLESLSLPTSYPAQLSDKTAHSTDHDDGEFEFRLFSTSARTPGADPATAPRKIILRSPSPSSTNPGFVIPHRPKEYFFAGAEHKGEFQIAAVTGEGVLAQRNIKWTGCHLPWRVTTLISPIASSNPSLQQTKRPTTLELQRPKTPKHRASKKRRIINRKKNATDAARSKQATQIRAEQEAAEREKRTRRNREKKVKKKEREKAKKMEKTQGDSQDTAAVVGTG